MAGETFLNGRVQLCCGDSLHFLRDQPAARYDSIVTDPPYALVSIVKRFGKPGSAPAKGNEAYQRASRGFMGKQWDTGETAFSIEFWAECLRVLKPGGHVVAFSGTRTYHRMACAIEDAGFEIRDQIGWTYGSGFPKSHNIGGGWGTALKPAWEPIALGRKPIVGTVAANMAVHGVGAINVDGCRVGDEERINMPGSTNERVAMGGGWRPDAQPTVATGRWPANIIHDGSEEVLAAFPETETNAGTAQSVHRAGTWGIATQEGRTLSNGNSGSAARFFKSCQFTDEDMQWRDGRESKSVPAKNAGECINLSSEAAVSALSNAVATSAERLTLQSQSYRAPFMSVTLSVFAEIETLVIATIQNLERRYWLGLPLEKFTLRSDHADIVAIQKPTGITRITISRLKSNGSAEPVIFNITAKSAAVGEAASASRLFYTAKADSDDRLGSKHPTVKPVDLMQWLVRLVTPKGGLVLDPFAGTGTTAEACYREGMRCMLVERETEYQADIRRRMALVLAGPDERKRESIKAKIGDLPFEEGSLFA